MADDTVVIAQRNDIDDIVFSACTEVAEGLPGLSVREKTKFAIAAADRIMVGIDELGGKTKRSEAGRKAAEARHSKDKPKPTPGPAIPPPPIINQPELPTLPPVPPTVVMPTAPMNPPPPPPHPALAPNPAAPFGNPPQ